MLRRSTSSWSGIEQEGPDSGCNRAKLQILAIIVGLWTVRASLRSRWTSPASDRCERESIVKVHALLPVAAGREDALVDLRELLLGLVVAVEDLLVVVSGRGVSSLLIKPASICVHTWTMRCM